MTLLSRVAVALLVPFLFLFSVADRSRAQETAVAISNTTGDSVVIVAIGADNQQQFLHELAAGEIYSLTLPVGSMLGFAQAGSWLGDRGGRCCSFGATVRS